MSTLEALHAQIAQQKEITRLLLEEEEQSSQHTRLKAAAMRQHLQNLILEERNRKQSSSRAPVKRSQHSAAAAIPPSLDASSIHGEEEGADSNSSTSSRSSSSEPGSTTQPEATGEQVIVDLAPTPQLDQCPDDQLVPPQPTIQDREIQRGGDPPEEGSAPPFLPPPSSSALLSHEAGRAPPTDAPRGPRKPGWRGPIISPPKDEEAVVLPIRIPGSLEEDPMDSGAAATQGSQSTQQTAPFYNFVSPPQNRRTPSKGVQIVEELAASLEKERREKEEEDGAGAGGENVPTKPQDLSYRSPLRKKGPLVQTSPPGIKNGELGPRPDEDEDEGNDDEGEEEFFIVHNSPTKEQAEEGPAPTQDDCVAPISTMLASVSLRAATPTTDAVEKELGANVPSAPLEEVEEALVAKVPEVPVVALSPQVLVDQFFTLELPDGRSIIKEHADSDTKHASPQEGEKDPEDSLEWTLLDGSLHAEERWLRCMMDCDSDLIAASHGAYFQTLQATQQRASFEDARLGSKERQERRVLVQEQEAEFISLRQQHSDGVKFHLLLQNAMQRDERMRRSTGRESGRLSSGDPKGRSSGGQSGSSAFGGSKPIRTAQPQPKKNVPPIAANTGQKSARPEEKTPEETPSAKEGALGKPLSIGSVAFLTLARTKFKQSTKGNAAPSSGTNADSSTLQTASSPRRVYEAVVPMEGDTSTARPVNSAAFTAARFALAREEEVGRAPILREENTALRTLEANFVVAQRRSRLSRVVTPPPQNGHAIVERLTAVADATRPAATVGREQPNKSAPRLSAEASDRRLFSHDHAPLLDATEMSFQPAVKGQDVHEAESVVHNLLGLASVERQPVGGAEVSSPLQRLSQHGSLTINETPTSVDPVWGPVVGCSPLRHRGVDQHPNSSKSSSTVSVSNVEYQRGDVHKYDVPTQSSNAKEPSSFKPGTNLHARMAEIASRKTNDAELYGRSVSRSSQGSNSGSNISSRSRQDNELKSMRSQLESANERLRSISRTTASAHPYGAM